MDITFTVDIKSKTQIELAIESLQVFLKNAPEETKAPMGIRTEPDTDKPSKPMTTDEFVVAAVGAGTTVQYTPTKEKDEATPAEAAAFEESLTEPHKNATERVMACESITQLDIVESAVAKSTKLTPKEKTALALRIGEMRQKLSA